MSSLAPPINSTALPARSTTTALSADAPTANTATAGQDELWSGILNSVKGSKSVQTKQAFVLGAPGSGKRTLLSRLRTTTGDLPSTSSSSNGLGKGKDAATHEERRLLDLGLSCEVLDVRDEGDEGETLARLSLFRLPSPAPPFPSLLSLALTPQTLLDSLVVLVLDWERPWRFVEELEGWVGVLEERLGRKRGEREGWEEVEGRERLESYLRSYHEPPAPGSSSSTAAPATSHSATAAAAALDPDTPLPPGTLTDNLGIGLVIVCTKADQMNTLERDREFNDEQFDYIQQTLRTVALRYGAAVFYTSQTNPSSYAKLRQYLLHKLFSAPSSSSALAPSSGVSSGVPPSPTSSAPPAAPVVGAPGGAASASTAFPFPHRANVIDRDAVLVPTGWDSWGKIRILRERFECEAVGEGFAADVARRLGREREEGEGGEGRGLRREYEQVVVDFEGVDQPLNLAATVSPLDEQSFLSTHYETLQADAAKDPRLAFRQQPSSSSSLPSSASALAPSVVGPMAGSTLELPTVVSTLERARERAAGGGGGEGREELGKSTRAGRGGEVAGEAFARGMSRQNSQTSTSARSPPLPPSGHSPSLSSSLLQRTTSSSGPSGAASPPSTAPNGVSSGGAGTAAGAAGGNQVLADFFQSLLTARTAGGAAAGSGTSSPATTTTAGAAAGLGASTRRTAPDGGEK